MLYAYEGCHVFARFFFLDFDSLVSFGVKKWVLPRAVFHGGFRVVFERDRTLALWVANPRAAVRSAGGWLAVVEYSRY
jgi:hypothetical protein